MTTNTETPFIVTLQFMAEQFKIWNHIAFNDTLPRPILRVYPARRYNGQFRQGYRKDRYGRPKSFMEITLSTNHPRTADRHIDTLLHEMIHLENFIQKVKETSHGPVFQRKMQMLNKRFGRHITISEKSSSANQPAANVQEDNEIRFFCLCRFRDGNIGICIPARTQIFNFNRTFTGLPTIESVRWFLAYTSFLKQYPSSRKPKLYKIDDAVLEKVIKEAKEWQVRDGRLRPKD